MKVRIRFVRLGKIRFTSHRDVARIWERAIRRAEIPVVYSQGFTPRPRLSFGLALSTGYESLAEYLDIEVDSTEAPDWDNSELSDALPSGIDVTAKTVVEAGTISLQQAVTSCSWDIGLRDIDVATAQAAVDQVLSAESIPVTRERKGKKVNDDLRPAVYSLALSPENQDGVRLLADLGAQPRSLRPSELLLAMGLGDHEGLVRRTHQWIDDGTHRSEPITLDRAVGVPPVGDTPRRDEQHVRSNGLRGDDAGRQVASDLTGAHAESANTIVGAGIRGGPTNSQFLERRN